MQFCLNDSTSKATGSIEKAAEGEYRGGEQAV